MERPHPRFRYGTLPVAPAVLERYQFHFPAIAHTYPLPADLPRHHPCFERLRGRRLLTDDPPPWWSDFVATLVDTPRACLIPLFKELAFDEFRAGSIASKHWHSFAKKHTDWVEQGLCACQGNGWLPESQPSLGQLLTGTPWSAAFAHRGPTTAPSLFELICSDQPDDILTMSQDAQETFWPQPSSGILSSLCYDTGVALAVLIPQGINLWEEHALTARVTLRVLLDDQTGQEMLALGATHHHDLTAATHLLQQIIGQCEAAGLAWGCLKGTNTWRYLEEGLLGKSRCPQRSRERAARSLPFWHPRGWPGPPLEGGGMCKTTYGDGGQWSQFHLTVQSRLP